MNSMVLAIATRRWEGWERCVQTWHDTAARHHFQFVVCDCDVMQAYQYAYEGTVEPILAFIHDDVEIFEKGWDERVLQQFDDPTVGMVGFGGATRHGRPDLYKSPYDLPQLGRFGFRSNMRTAELHGQRFTGESDVAVLDGFAMFVRRSILDRANGWPLASPIGYFCYDYWLSCEVRRQGYRIRLVGVDCNHIGGRTALASALTDSHADAHRWLYDHSRDVLPFEVPNG